MKTFCQTIPFFLLGVVGVIAQEPKLMLPIGHTSYITSAVFSRDGSLVLTASLMDKTAKIWDAQTGHLLLDLKGETNSVKSAVFSPDSRQLLTTSYNNAAKVWNVQTGQVLLDLKGNTSYVTSAIFNPDGSKVLTVSYDNTAKVWDAQTGQKLVDLRGNTSSNEFPLPVFSSDGKRILAALRDHTVKVWDAQTGQVLLDLKEHTDDIKSAIFSPDGNKIMTASSDRTAKVWDAKSGQLLLDLKGHSDNVESAVFSPDQRLILTASSNKAVIWDAKTGQLLLDLKGHTEMYAIKSAVFSPDGSKVLTASSDKTAKVWDAQTGQLLQDLKGHADNIWSAVFSPDGNRVLTASWDHTAKVWDSQTGQLLLDLKGNNDNVTSAVFSLDGSMMLTASSDRTAKVWDTQRGHLLLELRGHTDNVSSAEFSSDGSRVVTASSDSSAKVWDTKTGKLLLNLKGHKSWVTSAVFSPDGKRVLTVSSDKTAKVWDMRIGHLLLDLKENSGSVQFARFSPDGSRMLIVPFVNKITKVWNTQTGQLLLELKGHTDNVSSAEFSPNGSRIVTASTDNTAKVWDAQTGQLLQDLKGHTNWVMSAQYSPDGNRIVTASRDKIAKVWDAQTGQLLLDLKGHTNDIQSAVFSPDGTRVLTRSDDQTAKVWDIQKGELQSDLKEHTLRITAAVFSPEGKYILTSSADNTCKLWNAKNGQLLYTFIAVDSTDYLVVDKVGRFDGTEAAQKIVYYNCNDEVVELEQFKSLSREYDLASKILNNQPVFSKGIRELDICGRVPLVENKGKVGDLYHFKIIPRKDGAGIINVFVNEKRVKIDSVQRLTLKNGYYEYYVKEDEVHDYFISGIQNKISIQVQTSSKIASMKAIEPQISKSNSENTSLSRTTLPKIFIISIGISQYKNPKLNLRFASKDAQDFAFAMSNSARALFNNKGSEQVHLYLINSDSKSNLPLKSTVENTFKEVKEKAMPNDVVIVFFSGHGASSTDKKFYFLTAEAAGFNIESIEKEVAISHSEIQDWLTAIKAHNQILILDACYSGQVVKEGDVGDLMAKKKGSLSDDQKKAIEELKDNTGSYILMASSGLAYETSSLDQGLLTYALLWSMKTGAGVDQNGFLQVAKWFNSAAVQTKNLAKSIGFIQEPIPFGKLGIPIGKVDETVRNQINLLKEKPILRRSIFVMGIDLNDDYKVTDLMDNVLTEYSMMGKNSPFVYVSDHKDGEHYSIRGTYEKQGEKLIITYNLIKNENEKLFSGKVEAKIEEELTLIKQIVEKVKGYFEK